MIFYPAFVNKRFHQLARACGAFLFIGWNAIGIASGQVPTAPVYVQVSAGASHAAALDTAGTIWVWGRNNTGQLGNGTLIDKPRPQPLATPANAAPGTRWTTVVAGTFHSAALRSDGSLWVWGENGNGQLGDGTYSAHLTPTLVAPPAEAAPGTHWTRVSLGANHTLAIRSDSTLWGWGANYWSQLGDGSTQPRLRPVPIATGRQGDKWLTVATSSDHTLGVTLSGLVWGWGRNHRSQLGSGVLSTLKRPSYAFQIPDDKRRKWAALVTGEAFSLGLEETGELWASGDNFTGQLGGEMPPPGFASQAVPVTEPPTVAPNTRWVYISARGGHALALRSDGTLWSWGENYNGQLGINSTNNPLIPVQEFTRNTWTTAAAGDNFALALKENNLFAAGANEYGQLGDGTGRGSLIFRAVTVITATSAPVTIGAYNLYPNPATDQVHIKGIKREAEVRVIDPTGRVMLSGTAGSNSLSVANLPRGIYFVHIRETGAIPQIIKLIVN